MAACAGGPYGIVTGSDGAMWFTETGVDKIGRIATSGAYNFFTLPAQASSGTGPGNTFGIAAGSDGALWFTRVSTFGNSPTLDRSTTSGTVTETAVSMLNVYGITAGPDGALWFAGFQGVPEDIDIGRAPTNGSAISYFPDATGGDANTSIATGSDGALWYTNASPNISAHDNASINRLTLAGAQTAYSTSAMTPVSITGGPDGALWYTEYVTAAQQFTNAIGRIAIDGTISNFTLPVEVNGSGPTNSNGVSGTDDGITAGPDGALWFTDPQNNSIDRISTTGRVTAYAIPTAKSFPQQIAAGPDGALWFTENQADKIGRITTSGSITEYPLLCATAPNSTARTSHASALERRVERR